MRSKDVSRPFCLMHLTLYIPLTLTASDSQNTPPPAAAAAFSSHCRIFYEILNTAVLTLILHVTYMATFCAPGGDSAAEIEARAGGERAK